MDGNNKRGKIKDLFRKIGYIKAAFQPKMGTIKDKNGIDLVDLQIMMLKQSWRHENNTQKNYVKKILMNLITMMVWLVSQSQPFWSAKSSGP